MGTERKKAWYVAGVFLMMFTGAVCTTTQGVMLTNYIEYYGLESSAQGLMSAVQSGGNLAALFLIGVLQRKYQKSSILLFTAVAIPAVFFLFGLQLPFCLFLAGYGIYGIAFGFMDSLASSIMVDFYPEKSSQYMNLLHGIYGLGGLAGPIFLRALDLRGMQWQKILFVTGCLALASAVIYGIGTKGIRNAAVWEKEMTPMHWKNAGAFFKDKKKRLLFLCAFLYGAHQIGITVWVDRYISQYLHTPGWGAAALSVFWVAIAASRLLLPGLGIDPSRLLVAGNLVSGLAVLCGVLSGNGFVMLVCVGISGFAEGTLLPITLDKACHWEIQNTALGSSMVLLAHYIGFIVTPMVMGKLIADCSIFTGMLLPAVLPLVSAALAGKLRKEEAKEKE